jgi:hypothetical protein
MRRITSADFSTPNPVIPGLTRDPVSFARQRRWISAFAGMTMSQFSPSRCSQKRIGTNKVHQMPAGLIIPMI